MKILYRISDGSNVKTKLAFGSKIFCLSNFFDVFKNDDTVIVADNCADTTLHELSKFNAKIIKTSLGSLPAWRFCAEYAIKEFSEDSIVYFVEDDYLHLPESPTLIEEGLKLADYVTLYDHPDKYVDKENGGNPYVRGGGERTRVLLSKSSHWKQTNSTTHTFAVKVRTLKEDKSVWWKHTEHYHGLNDFEGFKQLSGVGKISNYFSGKRRKLISCIPGRSTHIELAHLAPLVDWNRLGES